MNRRDFLSTSAASGLALVRPVRRRAHEEAPARRPDRLRLVRQVRPVPADPGRAGRGRLALRRRSRRCSPRPPRWSPPRQASKKKPRTYGDYREMLKEKDLDIVLIGTPDHWHALPMIAAVEAGADVYVQKPISVDVVEGQAMVAAARKHKRVVQVGTQRRSTPHLIEARDRIVKRGQARQDRPGRDLLLLPHAGQRQPARHQAARVPRLRDVDRPGPDAAVQRAGPPAAAGGRSWSTATASSATCASTCSTWSAGCSTWAGRSGSARPAASSCEKDSKANITDTQTATFDFGDLDGRLAAPHLGRRRPTRSTPGARPSTATRARSRRASTSYDFIPLGQGQADPQRTSSIELDKYPEDKTEKDLEQHVAPAIRGHMQRLPRGHRQRAASRWPTSSRATSRRRAASWPTCRCSSAGR